MLDYGIATPPRNVRQFRLGWLPTTNWFRNKYEQEAQIITISIDGGGSPVRGGFHRFWETSPDSNLPCLTTMSPDGEMFAVAYTGSRLEVRHAENGNVLRTLRCKHPQDHHKVIWMYFVDEISLATEYQCGNVYKHYLGEPRAPADDIAHALPLARSPPSVFSTCSLDRSTIFRSSIVRNSDLGDDRSQRGRKIEEGLDRLVLHPGESLAVHVLNCRSWETRPLALPSLEVSETLLLDTRSFAISRDNQYVALVLLKNDKSPDDTCRLTHVWSIKDGRYLGFRNVRGPSWESWIPANQFKNDGGDHRFVLRQGGNDPPRAKLDFVVDVYHHEDVRLHEDTRPHAPLSDCWVYFVVHGGRLQLPQCSSGPIAFHCGMNARESIEEFSCILGLWSAKDFALCVRANIHVLQEACHGIPLHLLGALDQSCAILAAAAPSGSRYSAYAASDVFRAADEIAHAARDIALAAPDVSLNHSPTVSRTASAVSITSRDVDVALTDSDVVSIADSDDALAAHDFGRDGPLDVAFAWCMVTHCRPPQPPIVCAAAAAGIAAHAATLAVSVSGVFDLPAIDVSAMQMAGGALYAADDAARAAHASLANFYPDARIQYSGVLKNTAAVPFPHYLVFPVLANPRTFISHQSGGSRVVLGGHAHPSQAGKWVPVCVLDFRRLSAPQL
jgi:hypothetical protein